MDSPVVYRTTWYTNPGGWSWAFSVRPDIWPPGSVVDTVPPAPVGVYLSDRGNAGPSKPLDEYSQPGAAEALVLAGRVELYGTRPGLWVEVVP